MTEEPQDQPLEELDEDEASWEEPVPAEEPPPDSQTHGETGDGPEES
jgi:hypothetical protein